MVIKGDLKAVLMTSRNTDGLYKQSQPLPPPLIPSHLTDTYAFLVFDQTRSFSSMPPMSTSSTSAAPPDAGSFVSQLSAHSNPVDLTEPPTGGRSMMGQTKSSRESGLRFQHNSMAAHPAASRHENIWGWAEKPPNIWAWAEKPSNPGNSLAVETPPCVAGQSESSGESGLGFKHDCMAAHLAAPGEIPGQSSLQPPTSQKSRGTSQPKAPPHHASPISDISVSYHPEAWKWVGEPSAPGNSAARVHPASSTSRLPEHDNSDDEGSATGSERDKSHLVSGQQSRMTLAESPETPIG